MRKFINNTKGAVTVFVTMLLIPAMLISGTAVDLARIHTARSIIQDANQLAANSVLTQYNALLYDLYGLFGVAEDDPILAQLLDEYIKVSVFGDIGQDKSMGTLQLFYGSNISLEDPIFMNNKNLRNEDVLRRQIEEYMKFRGPVVIVKDILDLLGSSTFKEDTGVINDKLEIDSAIADIYEKYKELYDAIQAADKCDQVGGGIVGGTVGTVSSSLDLIRQQFVNLKVCYEAWKAAVEEESEEVDNTTLIKDLAAKYRAILINIRSRTIGGPVGSNWSNGRWLSSSTPQGLNKTIENAKDHADTFKPKFDVVVDIAREIDEMKDELSRKIDELEARLDSGECNAELHAALTEETGSPAKSMIDRYRDILRHNDIEGMSNTFKDGGNMYIDEIMKPLLDDVRYRNGNNPAGANLTRAQLESISSSSAFTLSSSTFAANSSAARLVSYTKSNITYNVPPGFLKFGDHPENKEFFEELEQIMNRGDVPPIKLYDEQKEASGKTSADKQRNMIKDLLELANKAYKGLANEPLGARYIHGKNDSETEAMNMQDITKLIPQAMNESVTDVISNPTLSLTRAADYLLLLSYCTSVFSNYTTTKPDSVGKTRSDLSEINFPNSITGIPLSPEVNYFFQSEWEYLYNGNENASKNLSSVTRLIFLVRLICNYITVFSVNDVTRVVETIRAAFVWSPPLGLILGELARAAFVAAESTIDVATLRAGHSVPLIKSGKSGEWKCSLSGIKKLLADVASNNFGGGEKNETNEKKETDEKGLSYSNYLTFFFVGKALLGGDAATELAKHTANLIEWNVVNYTNGIFSDESKMEDALSETSRFKLIDMKTDFSLCTTVDMRMLFLSMVFAQDFSSSRGIGMQTTMPVTVTDHRGY